MSRQVSTTKRVENATVVRLIRDHQANGDRRAIESVLELHGRLLNHIARRYVTSAGEPYADLLQVGYLGLLKAVKGYSANSTADFSSYAYSMIDGEIRHHLRDTGMIKKPRWARSLYAQVSEANARLTTQLGRPPLVEEIAEDVNVAPEGILDLMKLYLDTDVDSLDARNERGGPDLSNIRSIEYETFSLPIEDRIQLEQALQSLSDLQKEVVFLFFYKDLSQTEIGKRLGLPQRKISRIVADSVRSLRDRFSPDK